MARLRLLHATLAVVIALVATLGALPVHVALAATTITDCSNADAIEAQLEAGGDIVLSCGAVTIALNNQIDTNERLSIDGGGATFSIGNTSYLFVNANQNDLKIKNLTLRGSGTAIQNNHGFVTIANSTFVNNQKALVSLDGIIDIQNSSFTGATLGAIEIYDPYGLAIADSTFTANVSPNDGGALYVHGIGNTVFSISGGSFSNNHAARGGAIFIDNTFGQSIVNPRYIRATIDDVSFSENSAGFEGGAIWAIESELSITNNAFSANGARYGGGAIYDAGPSGAYPSSLIVSSTTFNGNTSGGALYVSSGAASVTNSTFSGNTAAILNGKSGNIGGVISVSSSTLVGTGSTGLLVTTSGTTSLTNSILDAGTGVVCVGTVSSGGTNLASDASCGLSGAGDRNSTAPLLGPLASNGGPTSTHLLLAGSPAIDSGACPGLTVDQRGVTRPQGAACDIGALENDSSGPETGFTNPPGYTGASGGPFVFSSSEAGSTFQCMVDSGPFNACANPASFPGLSEGTHTLQVRAVDQSGQIDATPVIHTWIVDGTPPETNDVVGPGPATNNLTATFTLSGSDANGVDHFQCYVRNGVGQPVQGPANCTSPASFTVTSLAVVIVSGWTLTVWAVDKAGNVDPSPIIYTWRTDLWPPETTLASTPPQRSSSSSATFTFSAVDNFPTYLPNSQPTFQCKLDSADFAACTNPQQYSGLADGPHTFVVQAVDLAGNVDPAPRSYAWTVDASPPDTTIQTQPASVTNASAATFTFSGNDALGIAGFDCRLDNASFAACTSPTSFTDLVAGAHTFQVRAIDTSGQSDPSPAEHTWTIDTIPPDTTLLAQPLARSSSATASFTFSGSDATSIHFECQLDAAAFVACSSPAEFAGLLDGAHTFRVRAIDAAGNVDPTPASYSWAIDTALAITSADSTTFTVGSAGSFVVTTDDQPAPSLRVTGTLPDGVAFNAASGALGGTPASGTGGTYPLTITASNDGVPDATQAFTLTVAEAPAFVSADHVTFQTGTVGSFNLAASGYPSASFSTTSSLPTGVTLGTNGLITGLTDTTAAGVHVLALVASNGTQPDAIQTFTLTVEVPDTVKPVVARVSAGMTDGKATNGSVPLLVSWAASDDVAVIGYRLQLQIDGGTWVRQYVAPSAISKVINVPTGSSYRVRVRAVDAAGNLSVWMLSLRGSTVFYEQDAGAVTYTGKWTPGTIRNSADGQTVRSTTAGATATLTFQGSSVAWVSARNSMRGKAEVSIDGVYRETIDLYAPSGSGSSVVYAYSVSGSGNHTLSVRVLGVANAASTGTFVVIDGFMAGR